MQTANLGTCSTRATSAHYASRLFLTNRVIATEDGDIPPRTLGLVLSRSVDGGVHEDLDLVNHGLKPVRFNLEIAIRSDFADLFEVKSGHIVRRGRIATEWSDAEPQLRTTYRNQDFCREVTILTRRNAAHPVYANGRISFEVNLPPGAAWHSCLLYELGNGKGPFRGTGPLHSKQRTVEQLASGLRAGGKRFSRSAPATTSSIASFVRQSRTWPRYGSRLRGRTKCGLCRPQECPGSWHSLAATA